MADSKISALTEATTLADTDEFVIASSGATKRVTKATLQTKLGYWNAIIEKASDETISASTTLQNDNELSFAVVGGSTYFFELIAAYDSPAAADFKHDFALSAGSVTRAFRQHVGFGPTTVAIQAGQVADITTVISCGSNAGEELLTVVRGMIIPSSDATFNWRWAQVASDGGNTIVKAGSTLAYRRVTI